MPSEEEMEKAFEGTVSHQQSPAICTMDMHSTISLTSGNLCRCTGYRPILDGYRTFCCKSNGGNCACIKDNYTGTIEVVITCVEIFKLITF